jgi:hypothetical protein
MSLHSYTSLDATAPVSDIKLPGHRVISKTNWLHSFRLPSGGRIQIAAHKRNTDDSPRVSTVFP